MNISFGSRRLEQYANNDRLGKRKLGPFRHRKFKQRLDQLKASETLEDLRQQPGRFHELKEDRKGQWACDLDHPFRLVFEPQVKTLMKNKEENYLWTDIKAVEIIAIEDYH